MSIRGKTRKARIDKFELNEDFQPYHPPFRNQKESCFIMRRIPPSLNSCLTLYSWCWRRVAWRPPVVLLSHAMCLSMFACMSNMSLRRCPVYSTVLWHGSLLCVCVLTICTDAAQSLSSSRVLNSAMATSGKGCPLARPLSLSVSVRLCPSLSVHASLSHSLPLRLTTGWPPVDQQFIRGTTNAFRSWLLTSVPTPNCLCKPLFMQGMPGNKFLTDVYHIYIHLGGLTP